MWIGERLELLKGGLEGVNFQGPGLLLGRDKLLGFPARLNE